MDEPTEAMRRLLEATSTAEDRAAQRSLGREILDLARKPTPGMWSVAAEGLASPHERVIRAAADALFTMFRFDAPASPEALLEAILARLGDSAELDATFTALLAKVGPYVDLAPVEDFLLRERTRSEFPSPAEDALISLYVRHERWDELFRLCSESAGARNMAAPRDLPDELRWRMVRELPGYEAIHLEKLIESCLASDAASGGPIVELLVRANDHDRRRFAKRVMESGRADRVLDALEQEPNPRVAAALAVAGARDDRLRALLLRYRESDDDRAEGTLGLLALGDARVDAEAIVEVIAGTDSPNVLRHALTALQKTEAVPKSFAAAVIAHLTHSDPTVRMLAAQTVGYHPSAARKGDVKKLVARVSDRDAMVALNACWTLRQLLRDGRDVSSAEKKLRALVKKAGRRVDEMTQGAAVAAAVLLGLLGATADPPLLELYVQALSAGAPGLSEDASTLLVDAIQSGHRAEVGALLETVPELPEALTRALQARRGA